MPAIQRIVETCLYVEDLDRADAFYCGLLGLERALREEGRHLFLRAGDGMLLLFLPEATGTGETLPAHGARGPGHLALGIAAADLDAWRRRLESRGVAIEHEECWPRGGRSLYFRDPAGNSLELITPGVWGLPSGW
jgi:catechol 2,3-dioxygenase-like lactoylglutathione lyase family enzyme